MTVESETAEARASQEATDWFILLQEEPDDSGLRRRFETWLAADPLHRAAWTATQRTTDAMARVPPVHAGRWQPFVARGSAAALARPARRGYVRRGMAVGVLAIAACLGFLVLPSLILRWQADYATGTSEIRTVQLDDGSTLVLAPDSAVEVAYSGAERRVRLLAGEAFFSVHHEAARPFRVIADGIETTDLGTAFDVRRSESGAMIAVQTGSVRVDYATASLSVSETLEAGQSIRVAWTGASVRSSQAPTQVAAWRQRQLIAQDQPMADVIDQLRPYFDGRIVLMDGALARRPVTGVYNLGDPVEALRGIAQAQGAGVRRITPWLLMVAGP